MPQTGVYVCHCGLNIAGTVDVEKVTEYAKTLKDVTVAKHYTYMCSEPGQRMIREDIKNHKLERVVIATCSPRMHEETFRKAVEEAGLNPYLLEIVNLREHVSWAHTREPEKATEKAKDLIRMGVMRAELLEPLERQSIKARKSILVVGGGIAGIQASLDLANIGFKIYLVERSTSIGGRMAQLDKTFPTLDCSACILTPKMVDISKHPNITLLTNSEVTRVRGFVGNYEVTITKSPRYVDETKCVGCELCVESCPVKVPDTFNENLSQVHAINIHSPHSVPKVASIDAAHCLRLKTANKSVCGKCIQMCEAKAIDFDQKPEEINIETGAVIIAVGSQVFDASQMPEYGYGKIRNVISNIEFERISDASGPTGGKILSPQTGRQPNTIVFIQCVGSRDRRFNAYCCRVGCMVSLKQAILAKEKIGENVNVYICHIDLRSFGKGYEEFYRRARDLDINFVSGIPSEIHSTQDGTAYFDVFDKGTGKLMEIRADLIVLANGLVPATDTAKINELFHASRSGDGFLLEAHPKLRPLESPTVGVFLAGTCQSPKDIPDTVAQASGAAAKAADLLSKGRIILEPLKAIVDEELCSGCRVCETVCPYSAIEIRNEKTKGSESMKAEVVEAMCQGCGACGSACPTGAITVRHFTNRQVLAEIDACCQPLRQKGGN